MEQLLKDGKEKRKEDKRFLASAIARHFTIKQGDLEDGHFVAIMAAMLEGSWDRKAVVKALHASEIDMRFHDIESEFMKTGILKHSGEHSLQFSAEFLTISHEIVDKLIESAPAKMLPLTEKSADWDAPFRTDLNLPIVSNLPEKNLKKITPKKHPQFYAAVNKAQSVAFKIPCYVEGMLNHQLRPLNVEIRETQQEARQATHPQAKRRLWKKARGLEQKRVQLLAQLKLIKELMKHDKLYFVITADYRGRLYYRGGIVTPQGNDFCKAIFQLAQ